MLCCELCVILHENECQVLKNKIRDFRKMTEGHHIILTVTAQRLSCAQFALQKLGILFQNISLDHVVKAVQKR